MFSRDKVSGNDSFLEREMKFARQWLYKKGVMVPQEDRNPVDVELESFLDATRTGKKPLADIEVGLADSIMVILANKAMDEGRRVYFNEMEKMGVKGVVLPAGPRETAPLLTLLPFPVCWSACMPDTTYRSRKAVSIENSEVRVTVLVEGGHIAEILHKASGVNPLWTPPWASIEPSTYSLAKHPEYGADSESKLLAGIMGHNLCMDFFGGPSAEEAAAGLTVHGEGSVVPYEIESRADALVARAEFPHAQLRFERRMRLEGGWVRFAETVENLSACDRPIAWTQHVTLGPPFLKGGSTEFRLTATRSKVLDEDFAAGKGYMQTGAEFVWPNVPGKHGATVDLQVFTGQDVSAGFTSHLMDPAREQAFFTAFSPESRVAFGYAWRRTDFPWVGIWEEKYCRQSPPWNGKTMTRGIEFGVSPIPEMRRAMIDRGTMFGAPCYRWIPARSRVAVEYAAFIGAAERIPENLLLP